MELTREVPGFQFSSISLPPDLTKISVVIFILKKTLWMEKKGGKFKCNSDFICNVLLAMGAMVTMVWKSVSQC